MSLFGTGGGVRRDTGRKGWAGQQWLVAVASFAEGKRVDSSE